MNTTKNEIKRFLEATENNFKRAYERHEAASKTQTANERLDKWMDETTMAAFIDAPSATDQLEAFKRAYDKHRVTLPSCLYGEQCVEVRIKRGN